MLRASFLGAVLPHLPSEIFRWESAKVSHKRVFALLTPEIHSCEMAQMLQKPVFALPGCQRLSVNTLLCDTLGLADQGDFYRKGVEYCFESTVSEERTHRLLCQAEFALGHKSKAERNSLSSLSEARGGPKNKLTEFGV